MFRAVIAAGGNGTRLAPITYFVNKCLAPVGKEKLMIDLPINFFKYHGIKDVTILSGANHIDQFVKYIGDGSSKELNSVDYVVQPEPLGIADIFKRIKKDGCEEGILLILGDNFFSHKQAVLSPYFKGMSAFAWEFDCGSTDAAKSFGQVVYSDGKPFDIIEKPEHPQHSRILTGLYYFPFDVFEKVAKLEPSQRNELEITHLLKMYMNEGRLSVEQVTGKWADLGQWDTYMSFLREGK
jgi:glucose-1-phosphate thymidylyltransferase